MNIKYITKYSKKYKDTTSSSKCRLDKYVRKNTKPKTIDPIISSFILVVPKYNMREAAAAEKDEKAKKNAKTLHFIPKSRKTLSITACRNKTINGNSWIDAGTLSGKAMLNTLAALRMPNIFVNNSDSMRTKFFFAGWKKRHFERSNMIIAMYKKAIIE
ncbi:hypothetical protein MHBO_004136 [Bonamia ostreae]|uniref:Uncharacterized protein n=1 Tax=Bonamia ostreae TaxID=126728 RepID=A0ABV2AT15_9EUKA